MSQYPYLGFGLGLRTKHYAYIEEHKPNVDWFEIISENYFAEGGPSLFHLEKIRANYPIVMHGVSLSIGSSDPLNQDYLMQLKKLIDRIQPAWISDHLCWTGFNGKQVHDLLPLPYTEEALKHVISKVVEVQEYLGRRILLENVSSYITYQQDEMSEWEFLTQVAKQADCLILLDINNIYVSSFNHQFDPIDYLNAMPVDRVQQFHLAGHQNNGDYILDTHDHPVIDEVWQLYQTALKKFAPVSVMIERDDNIPDFPELYQELLMAKKIYEETL